MTSLSTGPKRNVRKAPRSEKRNASDDDDGRAKGPRRGFQNTKDTPRPLPSKLKTEKEFRRSALSGMLGSPSVLCLNPCPPNQNTKKTKNPDNRHRPPPPTTDDQQTSPSWEEVLRGKFQLASTTATNTTRTAYSRRQFARDVGANRTTHVIHAVSSSVRTTTTTM
jgi:hypothetical protein